jgi:alkylation response protein AidB-like acyl-CoA dehydrogenase
MWRLTGEKTWTTWLPNLTRAFVSARIEATAVGGDEPKGRVAADPEIGVFLVDLSSAGVARRPGFEALGMRGVSPIHTCLTSDDEFLDAPFEDAAGVNNASPAW